jgi:hypothetical protein
LFFMLKSFEKYCAWNFIPKNFAYMMVGVILILAFAQYILSTPLLYSFVFLNVIISGKHVNYETTSLDYIPQL